MEKILFVSYNFYPPYYSGKLIAAVRRLQDIDPAKFEVVVITAGIMGYPSVDRSGNIRIFRSPYIGDGKIAKRLTTLIYWLWSLTKLLFEKKVAVVHFDEAKGVSIPLLDDSGGIGAWSHFRLLARIAKIRKIKTIYEHATSAIEGNAGHFLPDPLSKKFFRYIDHIVCVSDALYDAVHLTYPDKAYKIVYGVEEDVFIPLDKITRTRFRSEHGLSKNEIVFCFLGLVVERKGFDLISSVFPEVLKEHPNSILWCIGPRSHQESRHIHDDEIQKYIDMLEPVMDHVKFWGRIDDRSYLAKILGAADVFLFPTRREGFGLAPVEAMACGIPPIIARIPGVTDLANIQGETGFYIIPGSAVELNQAMLMLAGDKKLRERMGRNARQRVVDKFSWKGHVAQWERLYAGEF